MKQDQHENVELKKLQDEWYGRLRKAGFKDIEDTSRPSRKLIDWHKDRFSSVSEIERQAIEYYYDNAKDLINTYIFINETQKIIWELHCEGMSKRKIEVAICHLEITYKREKIGLVINEIAKSVK